MKKTALRLLIPFLMGSAVCLLVVAEDFFGESSQWPALLSSLLMPIRLLSVFLSLLVCKAVPVFEDSLRSGFHSPPSGPLVYCFVFLLTFVAALIASSIFRKRRG